ncbi:MAG: hypothetical protein Athens101410_697 [Parcubacteria group bacterium Athens1014_10]|nr:MAG: hypothetical protein Athens101410_697 [Parcubacteria group bacterium Athens1014_10]TSD04682.1 MAG: hypothetical protein Athens071412_677 [Parcubacteria group bacterium Athens0714_12]
MKRFFLIIFLLIPFFAFAGMAKEKVLLDFNFLAEEQQKAESDENKMWRAVDVEEFTVDSQRQTIILRGQGEMNLVSPGNLNFNYQDFDALSINFIANQDLDLRIIPDILTTAKNTFEFKKIISASREFKEYYFSLRHPFFAEKVDNIGFNFIVKDSVEIEIKSVKLYKKNFFGIIGQGIKDYFKTDTYSAYSANFFPAPRVWGHFAFIYFFPLFSAGIFLFFRSKKHWKIGIIILSAFWLFTDLRMVYEFLAYQAYDYKTWVKPVYERKTFRAENDFYQFIDFVKEKLPDDIKNINFYGDKQGFFTRKMQYLLYPIKIDFASQESRIYVVYQDASVVFNPADEKLYKDNEPISPKGTVIAPYYHNSFIFKVNDNN